MKQVIIYDYSEICLECKEAIMYDCGNCLKECKIDMEPNFKRGGCYGYEGPDDWKNLRIRDKED